MKDFATRGRRLLQLVINATLNGTAAEVLGETGDEGPGGVNPWYIAGACIAATIVVCLWCAWAQNENAGKSLFQGTPKEAGNADDEDVEIGDQFPQIESRSIQSSRSATEIEAEIEQLQGQIMAITRAIEAASSPSPDEQDREGDVKTVNGMHGLDPLQTRCQTEGKLHTGEAHRQTNETSPRGTDFSETSSIASSKCLDIDKDMIQLQIRELDLRITQLATNQVTVDEL